eukprot:1322335-Prymnesium_polylepis.1
MGGGKNSHSDSAFGRARRWVCGALGCDRGSSGQDRGQRQRTATGAGCCGDVLPRLLLRAAAGVLRPRGIDPATFILPGN